MVAGPGPGAGCQQPGGRLEGQGPKGSLQGGGNGAMKTGDTAQRHGCSSTAFNAEHRRSSAGWPAVRPCHGR